MRDEHWFTRLYTDHYPDVSRYAMRRLTDPDAVAELTQEVFVVAWRRRADVPDQGLPWLYGVARRLLANHWRGLRASPAPVPLPGKETTVGADHHAAADRLADVRRALATLSDPDRELLQLIGWEQLTLAEAARVLGCSRPTAAVRLHRARGRLTRALAGPTAAPAAIPSR
ncbi:siderophore-interacting protein [Virgisporangium aliadipatigenens]|uniref:Siderophore-interacting protein n=1 Tax=Virgisporangium aliadipatigenens TaxID=741659 RepID=A0A8J4DSQ8_9ACTN|nr:sigma-70 family RNA polymerase sigma factor [Virgisporangium aliadipatigenens]GIJ48416.1 siderophore-interacting protein [Virgisporangium aliadipatigenens]